MNEIRKLAKEVAFDTEEGMLDDWYIELGWSLPGEGDYKQRVKQWVKKINISKDEKNQWVIDTELKDGTKLRAVKPRDRSGKVWRSWWNVEADGRQISSPGTGRSGIEDYLDEKLLTDLNRYKKMVDTFDWTYLMSDDPRYYWSGERSTAKLRELYSKLSTDDKKEAYEYYKEKDPDKAKILFSEFKGASKMKLSKEVRKMADHIVLSIKKSDITKALKQKGYKVDSVEKTEGADKAWLKPTEEKTSEQTIIDVNEALESIGFKNVKGEKSSFSNNFEWNGPGFDVETQGFKNTNLFVAVWAKRPRGEEYGMGMDV